MVVLPMPLFHLTYLLLLPAFISSLCIDGQNNCLYCFDSTRCSTCSDGFGLTTSRTCLPCSKQNCVKCPLNYQYCTQCTNRNGPSNGNCYPCNSNCNSCPQSISICVSCVAKYRLYSDYCHPCASIYCNSCQVYTYICDSCQNNYGLDFSSSSHVTCTQCSTSNCLNCANNYYSCTSCKTGFVLDSNTCHNCGVLGCINCTYPTNGNCLSCMNGYSSTNNTCVPCSITNCRRCPTDPQICVQCNSTYGVSIYSQCINCIQINCNLCNFNASLCTSCNTGFGVSINGQCINCSQQQCIKCNNNVTRCTQCKDTYGPNSSGICVKCTKANCIVCSSGASSCTSCKPGYSLSNKNCYVCQGDCKQCQNGDPTNCTSCQKGFYLYNDECQACPNDCLNCSFDDIFSRVQCYQCIDSMYPQDYVCINCPMLCSHCILNISFNGPDCVECEGEYSLGLDSPIKCIEKCGDYRAEFSECDNGLGIDYDGCTDKCQIQEGFNCTINNLTKVSTCSYYQPVSLKIEGWKMLEFQNSFELTLSLFPPLHIFTYTDQLPKILNFDNQNLTISSITVNNNQFTLIVSFSYDIYNQTIQLIFNPINTNDLHFYSSVLSFTSFQPQLTYYDHTSLQMSKAMYYLSYIIMALAWIGAVLGLLLRRLAGLEAMVAVQISWISIVLSKSTIYLPFYLTFPLKHTTGLNFWLFETNSLFHKMDTIPNFLSRNWPHTEIFEYDKEIYANNFNLCMIIQVCSFTGYLIFIFIEKVYQILKVKISQQLLTQQEQEQQLQKQKNTIKLIQNTQQILLQSLMYFNILNLAHYTFSIFLYILYGIHLNTPSLAILITSAFLYAFNILMIYQRADAFDYFRYSFKREFPAIGHYYIFAISIISTVIVMNVAPKWAYFIIFAIFMIYTAAYRPYKQKLENYRAVWNLLTIVAFLTLQMYPEFSEEPINSPYFHTFLLICVLLLLCTTILCLICLIYYIVFICHIKPNMQKTGKQKIMIELEMIRVRDKMYNVENNNSIYKKIIDRKMNILEFSNSLQNHFLTTQQYQCLPISHRELLKQTRQKYKFQTSQYKKQIKSPNKSISHNLQIKFEANELLDHPLSTPLSPTQPPASVTPSIYSQVTASNYQHFLGPTQGNTSHTRQQLKQLQTIAYAYQIAVEQNSFINLTNALNYADDHMQGAGNEQKNLEVYQSAYDQIEEMEAEKNKWMKDGKQ